MERLVFDGFHKIVEMEKNVKGKTVKREKLLLKYAVGALVVDDNNRIGLVTQFRPVVGEYTKEIPAGVLDRDGLTPKRILLEELKEECNIKESDIIEVDNKPFRKYYMIIGNSDALIELYYVKVKAQKNAEIKEDNDVEKVEWVSLEELKSLVDYGSIKDAKTIIAYEYAKSLEIEKTLSILKGDF